MNGDVSSIDLLKKLEIDGIFNMFRFDSIFPQFNTLNPFYIFAYGSKNFKKKKKLLFCNV
jgi:hypothetical protein